MTYTDEVRVAMLEHQVRLLASALLELAEKAAVTWYYDDEQMIGSGVTLDKEQELRALITKDSGGGD